MMVQEISLPRPAKNGARSGLFFIDSRAERQIAERNTLFSGNKI